MVMRSIYREMNIFSITPGENRDNKGYAII
jgi:hypothetical protein